MNSQSAKINILLSLGVCAIILIAGYFGYQTVSSYQELLKEKEPLEENEVEETGEVEGLAEGETMQFITPMKALEEKSILMVIAFKDFRDFEYFKPKEVFLAAGANIKTASDKKGTAIGDDGGEVEVDFLVSEVNLTDFDTVVFIGGSGAPAHLDNTTSYNLAKEAISQDKVLAAICIAPTILAKAGVLEGKKATVWTSPLDKSGVKILEDNGAVFEDKAVVTDGKIITGSGADASEQFGMAIVELLTGI